MYRPFRFAPLAALALTACAAPSPKAPPPPDARPAIVDEAVPTGRLPTDVRPSAYEMTFRIDPSQDGFEASSEISIDLERPRSVLWMHSDGLDVGAVSLVLADGAEVGARFEQVDDWGVAKITLPEVIPPGAYRLKLAWSGAYRKDLTGLYRGVEGVDAYVYSHFEPIAARRAFPSFDEPAFKSTFAVNILAPKAHVAIANTPELSAEEVEEGWVLHRFAATPPLSSYLVAMAVGPFDVEEAAPIPPGPYRDRPIPLRAIAARGKGPQMRWSLEQVAGIMAETEAYFASPYPFQKLDLVAVTDFSAGAMENPGAITFRESILLVDGDSPADRRLRYATVVAHEIAHMWFGDLVTMPWWDDIWLNESFADWMEVKVTDAWDPTYKALAHKVPEVFDTMYLDSQSGARRIRQEIESNHDIVSAFDPISYEKGGAVLRMFEGYVGEEVFREGVRLHMQRHAFANADIDDLLESISEASGNDVATPFRTFLTQAGVPSLAMSLSCSEGSATLNVEQSRYVALGSGIKGDEQQWQVPMCVRYAVGDEVDMQCALLTQPSQAVELESGGCPDWLFPNTEARGYFRWSLDGAAMEKLQSAGWAYLSAAERIALADAVESAHFRGAMGVAETFGVMARLAHDDDPQVVLRPTEWLRFIHSRWLSADERPPFESKIRALYRPVYDRVMASPSDPERDAFAAELAAFLALVGQDAGLRASLTRQGEILLGLREGSEEDVPLGLRKLALTVAIDELGAPAWDAALARLDQTTDGAVRYTYLWGMGYAGDPELQTRAIQLRYSGKLRLNERGALARSAGQNPENFEQVWAWHVENIDSLAQTLPPAFMSYLPYNAYGFCDTARADEVEALMAPYVMEAPGGPRILSKVMEAVRMCGAAKAFHTEELMAWLGEG